MPVPQLNPRGSSHVAVRARTGSRRRRSRRRRPRRTAPAKGPRPPGRSRPLKARLEFVGSSPGTASVSIAPVAIVMRTRRAAPWSRTDRRGGWRVPKTTNSWRRRSPGAEWRRTSDRKSRDGAPGHGGQVEGRHVGQVDDGAPAFQPIAADDVHRARGRVDDRRVPGSRGGRQFLRSPPRSRRSDAAARSRRRRRRSPARRRVGAAASARSPRRRRRGRVPAGSTTARSARRRRPARRTRRRAPPSRPARSRRRRGFGRGSCRTWPQWDRGPQFPRRYTGSGLHTQAADRSRPGRRPGSSASRRSRSSAPAQPTRAQQDPRFSLIVLHNPASENAQAPVTIISPIHGST